MNDTFINLIISCDIDDKTPIEQRKEFRLVCNYYIELEPKHKVDFVNKMNKLTINDVLEQIYYYNEPLFCKIEKRGKPEVVKLNKTLSECKMLMYEFIRGELNVLSSKPVKVYANR